MCRLYFAMLFVCLTPVAIFAQEPQEPIPGDVNRDGTVDFSDFVLLAQNFGQAGPAESEAARRLKRLAGFWTFFDQDDQTQAYSFLFGGIVTGGENWAGLDYMFGVDSNGVIVVTVWDNETESYNISYQREDDEILINFQIMDGVPKGFIVQLVKGDPEAPLVIGPESGRKAGPGFVQYEARE